MKKIEISEGLKILLDKSTILALSLVKLMNEKEDLKNEIIKEQRKIGLSNLLWDIDKEGKVSDIYSFNEEADKEQVAEVKNHVNGVCQRLASK